MYYFLYVKPEPSFLPDNVFTIRVCIRIYGRFNLSALLTGIPTSLSIVWSALSFYILPSPKISILWNPFSFTFRNEITFPPGESFSSMCILFRFSLLYTLVPGHLWVTLSLSYLLCSIFLKVSAVPIEFCFQNAFWKFHPLRSPDGHDDIDLLCSNSYIYRLISVFLLVPFRFWLYSSVDRGHESSGTWWENMKSESWLRKQEVHIYFLKLRR